MDVEQQQGTWSQLSLFESETGSVRHGASGEGGTGPAAHEEWQASAALNRERALTGNLMERVCESVQAREGQQRGARHRRDECRRATRLAERAQGGAG